jgi:hypothetical protein
MPIGFIGGPVRLMYYFALLLSLTALVSTGAWARDILCATTRQPAERVICDYAILSNEYDDVFAQQQALLSSGKLSPEQLAHWRQSRNACNDVHCIVTVFAQWKAMAKSVDTNSHAAVAPVIASTNAMAPVGPASEPSYSLHPKPLHLQPRLFLLAQVNLVVRPARAPSC